VQIWHGEENPLSNSYEDIEFLACLVNAVYHGSKPRQIVKVGHYNVSPCH